MNPRKVYRPGNERKFTFGQFAGALLFAGILVVTIIVVVGQSPLAWR